MTDLDKLIDAVERGEATTWEFEKNGFYGWADLAYFGSLDAAKALHDALLPGWWWAVGTCRVSDDARVSPEGDDSVTPDGREWCDVTDVDMRPPGNPARAWLLAILKAYRAQQVAE